MKNNNNNALVNYVAKEPEVSKSTELVEIKIESNKTNTHKNYKPKHKRKSKSKKKKYKDREHRYKERKNNNYLNAITNPIINNINNSSPNNSANNDLKKKDKFKKIYRTNIINDQPYGEDFLGYDKYAHALSYILLSQQIDLPLSVGIFSSWGTGKSFLLKRIEHHIKEQVKRDDNKKIIIVNFNAWEYSGADVLWAGLVKNIYDATERKFTKCQTRFFRHFIYPFREKNRKQIIWFLFWWILRIIMAIASITIISTIHLFLQELTQTIVGFSLLGVSVFTLLPSIISSIVGMIKNKGKDTMRSAKNIENKVGFMADVKNELEILCDFMKYKNNYKFVVFIDDLDRCPSKQIIKILDAVMLLLSNKDFPFLTFLALDPRIIISSIESSFKENILKSGINGFEYLDKLIQIPFCIPSSSPTTKKEIMEILTRDKVEVLNDILSKIDEFLVKYNLYKTLNIQREDTNKNNVYKSKVKTIQIVFTFFHKKFGSLDNDEYKLKTPNHIYTIEEKCNFINKVLIFISTKLEVSIKNNRSSSQRYNFSTLEERMTELEDVINYKPALQKKRQSIINLEITDEDKIDIKNVKTKLEKSERLSDLEIVLYGNHLIENQDKTSFKEFLDLKKYLLTVIDVYTMWSPCKIQLDELLYDLEEILEQMYNNNERTKINSKIMIKSFSDEEVEYLNKIYIYLDGNCRRNKRIINIFSISRYIMGSRIKGWYQNKVINFKLKKKLIKLIVIAEQWPYRLSWIFQKLEDYRQCKIDILKIIDNIKNQTSDSEKLKSNYYHTNKYYKLKMNSEEWVNTNGNINMFDIFKLIDKKLLFHKELDRFLTLDYDPDIFNQFMNIEPFINIYDFYLLIPYLFNINQYIKNKIAEVSDKVRNLDL